MHAPRPCARFRWSFTPLAILALSVCATHAKAAESRLSLASVAQRWDLALTSHAANNQLELIGDGIELVVVPGLPWVRLNGRARRLAAAPVYSNAALQVPAELLRLLPPRPQALLRKKVVVILDPGHGGPDPGAIGYRGIREKDVNLSIARYINEYLRAAGVTTKMTRTGDSFPSLHQRSALANRTPNSIFVSIHANAARSRSAQGVETFVLTSSISNTYRSRQAAARYTVRGTDASGQRIEQACRKARQESLPLARSVQTRLAAVSADSNRGVRGMNLHVLRESYFSPAILVEVGFLTHPQTARRLATQSYRRRLAKAIATGILAYLQRPVAQSRETAWNTLLPAGTSLALR